MLETSVGKRLSDARKARRITIDEAAHATKLRPEKIVALENDDYSRFGGNAYAKGFLQIYSRFLGVDVSTQLRAMDTGDGRVNLQDYQYLNQAAPRSTVAVRRPFRRETRPPSILPLVLVMAIFGLMGVGFYLYTMGKRLGLNQPAQTATASAATPAASTPGSPAPEPAASTPAQVAAPAAPVPAVPTPTASAVVPPIAAPAAGAALVAPATTAPALSTPTVMPGEQVMRATSINPPSAATLPPAVGSVASSTSAPMANELTVEPLRKTWVTIRRDAPNTPPVFEDFVYPGYRPLKVPGEKFFVEVRDANSVKLSKNGVPIAYQAPGIAIQ